MMMEGCRSFQRLETKKFATLNDRITSENRYWSKFKGQHVVEHVAPVTYIEFCPTAPHTFAATASTRVHCYNPSTNAEVKTLSRFHDIAYSGSFRKDGKLMVAGGAAGKIQVMDMATRSILRTFKGHSAPVHVTKFAEDNVHVFSASDDKTCRYWDIPTQKAVNVFAGHTDYVRTAACNPTTPNVWATGGYDHIVNLWDVRSNGKNATMKVDHADPVESTLFLPSGGLLLTAGGNTIKVWDILSGGKLIHSFSNHQKTITSLALDGSSTRLLSSSLDGHIKVYDLQNYEVVHGFKFSSGITSFGISPDNTHLVVGTVNKELIVKERKVKSGDLEEEALETKRLTGGTFKYFMRGASAKASSGDQVVPLFRHQRIAPYDKALRKFDYKGALDASLETRTPMIVASMLEELLLRNGLTRALSGRNEMEMEPLLSYLIKFVSNPRFSPLLLKVCHLVCDLYFPILGQSSILDELFVKLYHKLKEEMNLHQNMLQLIGTMDTITAASITKQ